jgi:hypothetical protein
MTPPTETTIVPFMVRWDFWYDAKLTRLHNSHNMLSCVLPLEAYMAQSPHVAGKARRAVGRRWMSSADCTCASLVHGVLDAFLSRTPQVAAPGSASICKLTSVIASSTAAPICG